MEYSFLNAQDNIHRQRKKRMRTRNKTCNIGNYLPHLLVYIDKLPAFDNIDAVNEEHIYNIHYKQ